MGKCDLLRVELQNHLQLIEWLLREWKFDEIKTDRDALRQQMAKFDNLTPRCAAILKSLFWVGRAKYKSYIPFLTFRFSCDFQLLFCFASYFFLLAFSHLFLDSSPGSVYLISRVIRHLYGLKQAGADGGGQSSGCLQALQPAGKWSGESRWTSCKNLIEICRNQISTQDAYKFPRSLMFFQMLKKHWCPPFEWAGDLQLVVAFYAWRLLPGESFSSTLCSSHQKAVSRLHKATRIFALLQETVVNTRLKIRKHSRFFDRTDRIFLEFRKSLSEINIFASVL